MEILDQPGSILVGPERGVPTRDAGIRQENVRITTPPEYRGPREIVDLLFESGGFCVA
jgi:hypothetical protein